MKPLLQVKSLTVTYDGERPGIKNIDFEIGHHEIIAIVGESGCGKSTLVKSIFNLLPQNATITSGEILFNGENLRTYSPKQWRSLRGNQMAMIFQNPGAFLNPILPIGKQFVESIRTHRKVSKADAMKLANEMLQKMNLSDSERVLNSYPFQLSGGMKQRVAISMALCMKPQLILADEPTSALDVITSAQMIKEFAELKERYQCSILWVTHNIASACMTADRIIVIREGEIVEAGKIADIVSQPKSEYTRSLFQSVPLLLGG